MEELKLLLEKLRDACDNSDHFNLRKILIEIVPGFTPQSKISDILHEGET